MAQVHADEELVLELDELKVKPKELVLYNDDFNTFDFVIESLIQVCKHNTIQAEQCTYLVHFTGKCAVKRGAMDTLKSMCNALLDRGLTAEIL